MSLSLAPFLNFGKNKSVIVPNLKGGGASVVTNYRPMSLLRGFSKVFELVILARMFLHFRQKLTPVQHGFVSDRSEETNLCSYICF